MIDRPRRALNRAAGGRRRSGPRAAIRLAGAARPGRHCAPRSGHRQILPAPPPGRRGEWYAAGQSDTM